MYLCLFRSWETKKDYLTIWPMTSLLAGLRLRTFWALKPCDPRRCRVRPTSPSPKTTPVDSALKYVDTVQEQEQDKYVLGFSLYLWYIWYGTNKIHVCLHMWMLCFRFLLNISLIHNNIYIRLMTCDWLAVPNTPADAFSFLFVFDLQPTCNLWAMAALWFLSSSGCTCHR